MQHLRIAVTSGAISSTGDLLLQSREGRTPRDWELAQTGRVACYRMVHGPAIDACCMLALVSCPGLGATTLPSPPVPSVVGVRCSIQVGFQKIHDRRGPPSDSHASTRRARKGLALAARTYKGG